MDTKPRTRAEIKADRFKRLAPKRTERVIDALHSLGKCANRSSYSYSSKDVKQIVDAIEEELIIVKGLFRGKKRFSLK